MSEYRTAAGGSGALRGTSFIPAFDPLEEILRTPPDEFRMQNVTTVGRSHYFTVTHSKHSGLQQRKLTVSHIGP